MFHIISDNSADAVWLKAAKLLRGQLAYVQPSRLGPTYELTHVGFEIKAPRERWVFSRLPAINPAFAIAEVFWILSGSRDSKFINFWNPALPKFSGKCSQYHGAYGYRIRKNFGFDQLARAYNALANNPSSRQVVIQIWDSKQDFPDDHGQPSSQDVPCNISSLLKIRDGKLEWLQIMRSNDLYRGTPYNIVQFTMLQEIIAGWLNIEIGGYHQISDSLHVYESDVAEMKVAFSIMNAINNDSLAVTYDQFQFILDYMVNKLHSLTAKSLTAGELRSMIFDTLLPTGYKNLLMIAVADSARRRGWYEEMNLAAQECSNPALHFAWQGWRTRWIHQEG